MSTATAPLPPVDNLDETLQKAIEPRADTYVYVTTYFVDGDEETSPDVPLSVAELMAIRAEIEE